MGWAAGGSRRLDLSLAEYGNRAAALGRLRPERDDDGNVDDARRCRCGPRCRNHPTTSSPPTSTSTFVETRPQVLADHIRERHPGRCWRCCAASRSWRQARLPVGRAARRGCRPPRETLRHARCFSELTVGPQHVYNVLLARKARAEFGWDTDDLEARELARLDAWVELIADAVRGAARLGGRPPRVLGVPGGRPLDRPSHAASSWRRSSRRAVADPAGFAEDPIVHARIRDREIRLKAKRARLAHRSALENWNQAPFGGQLDYRWPITQELPRRHRRRHGGGA